MTLYNFIGMNQDIKDFITLLIICLFFIGGIQWILLRFTHWSVALIATVIIAFMISFLYVSLKHATPNGGSNGPDSSEFINPALAIFSTLLFGLFLVSYLTKTPLPKKVLFVLLALIIVFALGRYIVQYIENATFYQKIFSSNNLEIVDLSKKESIINQIDLKNSDTGISYNLQLDKKGAHQTVIPRGTDTISFWCYTQDNGSFRQSFPFDYNLCHEKDGKRMGFCFWLKMKVTLPLKIVLLPENKFSIYIDNKLVKTYQLSNKEADK